MVWSHNDQWMVTADHAGYIKYWQSNMNNVKMYQAHKEPIRGIRWDGDGASCTVYCAAEILLRLSIISLTLCCADLKQDSSRVNNMKYINVKCVQLLYLYVVHEYVTHITKFLRLKVENCSHIFILWNVTMKDISNSSKSKLKRLPIFLLLNALLFTICLSK